ncbi:hypothetical protein OROGR_002752 [Orobanche gracilis]
MDESCAHTASPRGFGGAVRRDENVQRPTCFTGTSLESAKIDLDDEALFVLLLPFKYQNLPTSWRQHPDEPPPPGSDYYSSLAVLPAQSPLREEQSMLIALHGPVIIALQWGKNGFTIHGG